MELTKEILIKAMPGINPITAAAWTDPLNKAMKRYEINTPIRIAIFLAQLGHESGNLSTVSENLNYSADRLLKVFGKYFKDSVLAASYARNPQKIANYVYANRLGNGPVQSGDGWKFKGGGPIQVTGRDRYKALSDHTGHDFVANPGDILLPEWGAISAGWFWSSNGFNTIADKPAIWKGSRGKYTGLDRIDYISVATNGGKNGFDDRRKRALVAMKALGAA